MEDVDLNRRLAEPRYNIPCSVGDARLELPELESPGNRSLASVGNPSSSGVEHHWDLQEGFVSRDSDRILLRAREDIANRNSAGRFLSSRVGKSPAEISANLRLIGEKQLMFPRLLGVKTRMEKGVRSLQYRGESDAVANKNGFKGNSPAGLRLRAGTGGNSSHRVVSSSCGDGISLREWLGSESGKVGKAERLGMFREIVRLVDFAHSQGSALQDLRPSCFTIMPSSRVQYTGPLVMTETRNVVLRDLNRKRPLEKKNPPGSRLTGVKCQKVSEVAATALETSGHRDFKFRKQWITRQWQSDAVASRSQLEKKWYASPEAHDDERGCSFSSNVYGLGVLLFELLCCYESWETHSATMLEFQRRIFPGNFLSENPIESAFCLRLLHPETISRPTTREILQSEVIGGSQDSSSVDALSNSSDDLDPESELLLEFFSSLKEEKESRASKLLKDLECLEEDIKMVERKYLSRTESVSLSNHKQQPCTDSSDLHSSLLSVSSKNEDTLMKNITLLEKAYFTMRSQIQQTSTLVTNCDKEPAMNETLDERVGSFFDGLCKFSCFSKFKVCGTLRNGDLFNSTNAICSLSFDRDEEYIAAAKVSKKIKIFEFDKLLNDTADIHYPVVEMTNKSKLSCICWNYYIRNYLASVDYDGVVKMWDMSTGKEFAQYTEHKKRAWSVDFSRADPNMFASGSDDCSVRLWSVNDKNSIGTIWCPANVCCVQFSDYTSHQLIVGSADYKIYGYDLRHVRVPLCTLSGHGKAVSYVKFVDAETIVSASTDNTLKLWDLKKNASSASLPEDSCSLTFKGHTNEKNFVGLSVLDGYIVCGSETNEVYSYYRALPMPISSHKFETIDPVSGNETGDDSGQFVSSVCWRRKSNTVVAANSSGVLKLLQMV